MHDMQLSMLPRPLRNLIHTLLSYAADQQMKLVHL